MYFEKNWRKEKERKEKRSTEFQGEQFTSRLVPNGGGDLLQTWG
jgi:hypothetical protein